MNPMTRKSIVRMEKVTLGLTEHLGPSVIDEIYDET